MIVPGLPYFWTDSEVNETRGNLLSNVAVNRQPGETHD